MPQHRPSSPPPTPHRRLHLSSLPLPLLLLITTLSSLPTTSATYVSPPQIQSIVGFTTTCAAAYAVSLSPCKLSNFLPAVGGSSSNGDECSADCQSAILARELVVQASCRGQSAGLDTLIGRMFLGTAVEFLCGNGDDNGGDDDGAGAGAGIGATPSSGATQTQQTQTQTAAQTSPSPSSQPSSTDSSPDDAASTAETSMSTASALPSTKASTESRSSNSRTSTSKTSSISTRTTSAVTAGRPTQTSSSGSSTNSNQENGNVDTGGGSPFDIANSLSSTSSSAAAGQLECTWAAVVVSAIVAAVVGLR